METIKLYFAVFYLPWVLLGLSLVFNAMLGFYILGFKKKMKAAVPA